MDGALWRKKKYNSSKKYINKIDYIAKMVQSTEISLNYATVVIDEKWIVSMELIEVTYKKKNRSTRISFYRTVKIEQPHAFK